MDGVNKEVKIKELEDKLKRYEEKQHKLLTEEDKAAGSRLGNEYVQNEVAVYEKVIISIKQELMSLRIRGNSKKND